MAICNRDGHKIFAKNPDQLSRVVTRYAEEHGYDAEEDFRAFTIPKIAYAIYLLKRDDPAWWIVTQGDALDELSPGRKELLAGIFLNPPMPKERGHRNRDYLRVLKMRAETFLANITS